MFVGGMGPCWIRPWIRVICATLDKLFKVKFLDENTCEEVMK